MGDEVVTAIRGRHDAEPAVPLAPGPPRREKCGTGRHHGSGRAWARRAFGKARSLIAVPIQYGLTHFARHPLGDDACHSMTSVARARIEGGTVRPSALAG